MRRALVPFLLAVAVLAGGCGDDGALSREEFVRHAGAVCGPVERRLEALPRPQTLAELEQYARRAGALTREGLGGLRELRPPEELEGAFERYLTRVERVAGLLDELEAAAGERDAGEAQRLVREIGGAAEASEAAREAGLAGTCEAGG